MIYRILVLVFLLPSAYADVWTDPAAEDAAVWQFDVKADKRTIGSHEFRVADTEAGKAIASTADFRVRLLFVDVFKYQHQSLERWQNDCLENISATTTMNRDEFFVDGAAVEGAFVLATQSAQDTIPTCVQTFAYWDPNIVLNAERLLNPQTGEVEEVSVTYSGAETMMLNGRAITADRYRLLLKAGYVDVLYDQATKIWVGLEALNGEGNLITYVPKTIPLVSA